MQYETELLPKAKKHYRHWEKHFPVFCDKLDELIEDIAEHPFTGLGAPELSKHNESNYWSRQISEEHSIVYEVKPDKIVVHSCRGRYA
jgi:toxin YoeB